MALYSSEIIIKYNINKNDLRRDLKRALKKSIDI